MTTRIYTLFSHCGDYLDTQLAALETFCVDLAGITIIDGPIGLPVELASGNLRINQKTAQASGIEVITISEAIAGHFPSQRFGMICGMLFRDVIPKQKEDVALLVHGDLFPLTRFTGPELLAGHNIAGRGIPEWSFLHWTWLAIEAAKPIPKPNDMGKSAKIYTAKMARKDQMPASYRDGYSFELCEPCWVHANRLTAAYKRASNLAPVIQDLIGPAIQVKPRNLVQRLDVVPGYRFHKHAIKIPMMADLTQER